MTNNPDKAVQLAANGIRIAGVRPTTVHTNTHNTNYLQAKKSLHFHTLDLDGAEQRQPEQATNPAGDCSQSLTKTTTV
jgi:hypothetical protein